MTLERCNYNQCCMTTHKFDLFIHAVKYFDVCSCTREQPADLAYDRLLDKAKSHETATAEYHLDNIGRKDSMTFPATVSTSIDAVGSTESYRSPSMTCVRCGFMHTLLGHCPASGTQYGKCSHLNYWQHMYHTQKTSRSPSRRAESGCFRDRY